MVVVVFVPTKPGGCDASEAAIPPVKRTVVVEASGKPSPMPSASWAHPDKGVMPVGHPTHSDRTGGDGLPHAEPRKTWDSSIYK